MAKIKKIYDDAERTTQVYPQTHERAVVDNNGTTAETKFQMITDLVNQKQMEIGAVPSDLTPTSNSTNWVTSGGVFQANIEKDAKNGYYEATILGDTITVNAPNYKISVGGNLRIKMPSAGTTATTLTIGNATNIPIWYNGAAVSAQNTWEANEIISVFYDGTRFMASNSQGGGGKAEKIKYNNSQSGLAAENVQGAIDKVYNELIIRNEIDLSVFNSVNLNTSGKKIWANVYTGKFIQVEAGEIYEIASETSIIFLLLKEAVFKKDISYSDNIAKGYTDRVVISGGGKITITIPDDCTILYIQTSSSLGDITPSLTKIEKVKDKQFETVSAITPPITSLERIKSVSDKYVSVECQYAYNKNRSIQLYSVVEGETIRLRGNGKVNSYFLFLIDDSVSTTSGNQPNLRSGRISLKKDSEADVVVPTGATILCVSNDSENGSALPLVIARLDKNPPINLSQENTLIGAGSNIVNTAFIIPSNGLYCIKLSYTTWDVTELFDAHVKYALRKNNVLILRKYKNDAVDGKFYFMANSGDIISVSFRGTTGTKVSLTLSEVQNDFNKKKYNNISFVPTQSNTIHESMMVMVGNGDLVKYKLNATSGMIVMKAFSRAIRNENLIIDSITADSDGVVEGMYMPTADVYLVLYSVIQSGFTPQFEILNYGSSDAGLVYPYQIVLDTDNLITLLSTTDDDVTIYDDVLLSYGQIIPKDGMYYMLYQAFGSWHTDSSNILMAYSLDGLNWTRGIPEGIEAPYEGTNVIFKRGTIVGEFQYEVINEFAVARVDDADYPFRMFCSIRNDNPSTIKNECHYLMKSFDLVHWTTVAKIVSKAHDSFSSMFAYGDKLLIYLRMWDYTRTDNKRLIGMMWLDIWGNVIQPPSGLFGHGLYNPGATRIGVTREAFIPTRLYVINESQNTGDGVYEAYIKDGDVIKWMPCYGLDKLKKETDLDGWGLSAGITGIGLGQYILYTQRQQHHGAPREGSSEIRLCPISWITYNSHNTSGD